MIESNGLTKELGGRTVVSDVTFRCEPGTVTGFLGPNGAGKTTTMRMLVGLSEPGRGDARILGARYRDLPNPGRRVGTLLDASAQHAGRRGHEALAVSARTMGVPAERVDAVLELVGLDETAARRRVGKYSLGMRQRLGLAHALLGDPEVLILDEPANGLDPAGMRDVRTLLRRLGDEGRTVFVSSHLLAEVEQLCDHVGVLARGRCVAVGAVDEVLASAGTRGVDVRLDDEPPRAGGAAATVVAAPRAPFPRHRLRRPPGRARARPVGLPRAGAHRARL